jgi:hypothetical protein
LCVIPGSDVLGVIPGSDRESPSIRLKSKDPAATTAVTAMGKAMRENKFTINKDNDFWGILKNNAS